MSKRIHRFTVSVNCHIPDDTLCTDQVQSLEQLYDDCGVLILPDSYSETGTPTRLVINCHGAGGMVSKTGSQIEDMILTKYLVANGYAVMDVNGLPERFAAEKDLNILNNIGSPIAVRAYVRGYHYCMERFNLKPDVFVHGGSMGGISSTNLVLSGSIPVIAQSGYCPVLDTYEQIFLRPWSGGLPKIVLGTLYRLDKDENGEYIYDEAKMLGHNPAKNQKAETYPVPVKFWHCVDDGTVPYFVTKKLIDTAKANGVPAYLRSFPYGGHEPQLVAAPIKNPCGKTVFDGETLEINPAVEEVLIWFNNFN